MAKQLHVLDKAQPKWRNKYTAFKQAQPEWQKISNYTALKKAQPEWQSNYVLDKAQPKWRNNYTAFKQAQPEWRIFYTALKRHSPNGKAITRP